MKKLVKTREFDELNVGFALDEGMASENEEFTVFYGERCIWCKCLKFVYTVYCTA